MNKTLLNYGLKAAVGLAIDAVFGFIAEPNISNYSFHQAVSGGINTALQLGGDALGKACPVIDTTAKIISTCILPIASTFIDLDNDLNWQHYVVGHSTKLSLTSNAVKVGIINPLVDLCCSLEDDSAQL
jgi:hypothetical protein